MLTECQIENSKKITMQIYEENFKTIFKEVSEKENPRISTLDDTLDLVEQIAYEKSIEGIDDRKIEESIEILIGKMIFKINYYLSEKLYLEKIIDLDGNIEKHKKGNNK